MRATMARMTAAPVSGAPWRPSAPAALRVDRMCTACVDDEKHELQREPAGPDSAPANGHRFGQVPVLPPAASPAQALSVSEPSDPGEQEAERVAESVMAALSSGTPPEEGLGISAASRPAVQRAPDAETPGAAPAAEGGFLVDDEASALPGQMRKSDFLRALRPAVCAAADGELARAGRSTAGCPYLDRWFTYYEGRDARQVERSLRRYAPETAGATSAAGYIAPVSARVARGVRGWVETGQVPELPDGMTPDGPGGGILGGLVSGVAAAASSVARGIGGALSALGSLFFKADAGGAARGVDGAALGAQLGEGRALDSASRSRMGAVFGYDFGAVRVHDDAPAAALAQGLNARAFTVGTHIAFGAGQHRPGQLVGDALLAHELAHVVQQGGARAEAPQEAPAEHDAVEQEADAAAVAATLALWDPAHEGERPRPMRRSGLQLRRCGGQQAPPVNAGMVAAPVAPLSQAGSAVCSAAERTSGDENAMCCTPSMLTEISGLRARAAPLVQNAITRLQTPDGVSEALQDHFRISPTDTASLGIVVNQLTNMLRAMQGDQVRFLCSDAGDRLCRGLNARSSNCSSGPKIVQLCGDYTFSTMPEAGGPYLAGSHWLKTLIHEYAHIGCSEGGGILPAGSESYSEGGAIPYPPDRGRAIHNADSYANFVLAVRP